MISKLCKIATQYVENDFLESLPFDDLLILKSNNTFWKIVFQVISIDRYYNNSIISNFNIDEFFEPDFLVTITQNPKIPTHIKNEILQFIKETPGFDNKANQLTIHDIGNDIFYQYAETHLTVIKLFFYLYDLEQTLYKYITNVDSLILDHEKTTILKISGHFDKITRV